MIFDLYRHRGYILSTALSDLRTQYAGSAMGVIWNVLQPLAMIFIYWVVFSNIVTGRNDTMGTIRGGYAIYLCSALLPWLAFGECITRGTNTFINRAGYLRKLPIPEQVFMAQTAVSALIGLAISYALLLVIFLALGASPSWTWLLLPPVLVALVALGFGIGLALGTINVFIRDVGQIVPILVRLGFWGYPIVYDITMVPPWFQKIVHFNPVYPFLESSRDLLIRGEVPHLTQWLAMIGWATLAMSIGTLVLHGLRRELRDVI
jgi:ABC-type polysaccharide/polyol phosphate export permease